MNVLYSASVIEFGRFNVASQSLTLASRTSVASAVSDRGTIEYGVGESSFEVIGRSSSISGVLSRGVLETYVVMGGEFMRVKACVGEGLIIWRKPLMLSIQSSKS